MRLLRDRSRWARARAGSHVAGLNAIPIDPGGSPCASTSTASLNVSDSSIALGKNTTVSWSFHPGPGCAATVVRLLYRDATSGVVADTGLRGANGSATLTPQNSGAYFLRAVINGWFADFGSEPVTVGLPEVNGRTTVEITQPSQNALFAQALGVPNAVVRVAGYLDLDLSYMVDIRVAPGVEIIGERTQYARGPRLFTTSFPRRLLDIGTPDAPSDNVRITGLRFDGGESSDPCDSAGVEDADAIAVFSSQRVQIEHNELFRWRGSTVVVYDEMGRINKENAGTVWVHDNYMHDNQHPTYCGWDPTASGHGGGYGVSVNQGGFALIERNVFDQNRHAITGHGSDGDGYLLHRNLFLRPGVDNVKLGFTNYNHQIDMHGLNTCGSGEHWNCGPAGDYMEVAWNTVVFPIRMRFSCVALRPTPAGCRCIATCSPSAVTRR
jgi:Right handed beta helix region